MQYQNTAYEIFEDGKCYSNLSGKFLTPQTHKTYPTYHLVIQGKQKTVYIHRMVAETFLQKEENKNIVNHKDGNTHNYHLSNLEWVNEKENVQHALKHGLKKNSNSKPIYYTEDLPNEKWNIIKNYSNYKISSYGRVLNIQTKRILKPYLSNCGYLTVNLWKNNKGKTFLVHRLVYENFLGELKNNFVINHKDGNKKNNNITNLEQISYKDNNLHATYIIRTNKSAKPVIQLDANNNIINIFSSIKQASNKTKIHNISRAIKNQGKAGGFYWKIKE